MTATATPLFPSKFLHANSLRFHYVETGPADGEPVLFLHGFPEYWYSWRYQLAACGQAGHRAIAPDLRGYHLSDKPPGVASYHMDHLLDDVVGIVEALGLRQVNLVAHDWGGAIAWAVAASPKHRHVVKRLVVMNAPHPAAFLSRMSLSQLRKSWYMLFFQLPFLPERWMAKHQHAGIRRAFQAMAAVPGAFSDEDLDHFVTAMAQPQALTCAINYYRALSRVNPLSIPARFSPIEVPTTLIWGEQDKALGKELTYDLAALVPHLTVHYLPEAGHWVQQELPEAVNRLLLASLTTPC